jgi:hypothetical protein
VPTVDRALRDLEEVLAEYERRAIATGRTIAERNRDLQAAENIRSVIATLRRLQADDLD